MNSVETCPKRHTIMHTDEKPFTCDYCPKEFRRKYDRNRHVKYVHLKSAEEQASVTDGLNDSDLGGLIENKEYGDLLRRFQQNLLPVKGAIASKLCNNFHHRKKTPSEPLFQCDYCDSKFKRVYDRTRHIKMAHHDIISPSLETLKILPESDEYEEVDVVEDSAPTPTEVDFKSESDIRQEL